VLGEEDLDATTSDPHEEEESWEDCEGKEGNGGGKMERDCDSSEMADKGTEEDESLASRKESSSNEVGTAISKFSMECIRSQPSSEECKSKVELQHTAESNTTDNIPATSLESKNQSRNGSDNKSHEQSASDRDEPKSPAVRSRGHDAHKSNAAAENEEEGNGENVEVNSNDTVHLVTRVLDNPFDRQREVIKHSTPVLEQSKSLLRDESGNRHTYVDTKEKNGISIEIAETFEGKHDEDGSRKVAFELSSNNDPTSSEITSDRTLLEIETPVMTPQKTKKHRRRSKPSSKKTPGIDNANAHAGTTSLVEINRIGNNEEREGMNIHETVQETNPLGVLRPKEGHDLPVEGDTQEDEGAQESPSPTKKSRKRGKGKKPSNSNAFDATKERECERAVPKPSVKRNDEVAPPNLQLEERVSSSLNPFKGLNQHKSSTDIPKPTQKSQEEKHKEWDSTISPKEDKSRLGQDTKSDELNMLRKVQQERLQVSHKSIPFTANQFERDRSGTETQHGRKACVHENKMDATSDHDPHEDDDDYPNRHGERHDPAGKTTANTPTRTLEEELTFLKRFSPTRYQVQIGFVPNMKVPAEIIVNDGLEKLLLQEFHDSCCAGEGGNSFIPALRQAANVAALPGIVGASLAMPDVHSGYGFCIGNVAAFDMNDPNAVISPGGVGFDINCGVRLIRTNLTEKDVDFETREKLADALANHIPVGVGVDGVIPCTEEDLDDILMNGVDWAIRQGYAWEEDKEHCEENGRMDTADSNCVSKKAKRRGLKQLGTLGGGNHYAEIQVVEEIYHPQAAETMGIGKVGQVCIMLHTGSRGLGHQVATDALTVMEKAMARDHISLNDLQLSCARIQSREGKEYLAGMSAAANFAWVNRSCITYLTRKAFKEVFHREPDDMGMHLVYDVSHNIAKVEKHVIDGEEKTLLVHRKGSTRAFPPHHPNIPKDYQSIGQPVLIGGTMGTCSYVLVGTPKGMSETFGSTCHGAGRALSRNQSRKRLDHEEVLEQLRKDGIAIRVASPKLVTEEAPESYKNVCDVIETCQEAGISEKVVKLRPIAVIKG